MQGWTAERVQQLAPDPASAKAGQGLAAARHWVSFATDGGGGGGEGGALWGECQGSGAKPYQVRVDLAEPAFKCSCPSRKFPCKHAIGLLLMFAAGAVPTAAARPAWVDEWFAERASRVEKKREKAEAPPKPVDLQAQQKRKERRLDRIAEGLAALKLWLHDLARTGIAAAPSRGYDFFDEQARRLIDAQAPGVARRVQALAATAAAGAGWQRPFLEQLSSLYLLIRGFERRESLPDAAREVLLSAIGVQQPQDDVLALPPIADRWQIIAQEVTVEDRLSAQHTWLLGERTGRLVWLLAFAHDTQPFDVALPPGFAFDGEVCLYPGDGLRGVVKSKGELTPITALAKSIDVDALLDQFATRRSLNPWLEGFAAAMKTMVPQRAGDGWSLADATGGTLALAIDEANAWTLLALSGGRSIDVIAYFDGRRARPLAAFVDGEYVRLSRASEVAA